MIEESNYTDRELLEKLVLYQTSLFGISINVTELSKEHITSIFFFLCEKILSIELKIEREKDKNNGIEKFL